MKTKTIIISLITIFSIILLYPGIQATFKIFNEPILGGYVPETTKPNFNYQNFIKGTFQKEYEHFAKKKYGLRAYYIKLYNQYQYSFFKILSNPNIVIGKENYLFGKAYINTFYGRDFIGKNSINDKINKLVFINDTLNSINIKLLPIFASSKGKYFEEYIPDSLKDPKTISNYNYYINKLNEKNINYIDFNDYFKKEKGQYKFPLYAKYGIHWTLYGGYVAGDSIIRFIENDLNIDLPDMILKKLEEKKPYSSDIDIEKSLNLILRLPTDNYIYPIVEYNKAGKDSLKILVVGDSFFYAIQNIDFLNGAFYDSKFMYYNNGGYKREPFINETDLENLKNEVEKYDYIILLANEATLHSFAWNFLEDLYNVYQQY